MADGFRVRKSRKGGLFDGGLDARGRVDAIGENSRMDCLGQEPVFMHDLLKRDKGVQNFLQVGFRL